MRYLIYKVTNLVNGKYYIGRHSTNDINDSYMGSGIGIKNAIKKYGIENFKKEIITEATSSDELWEMEKNIVNDGVVKDRMSYNMAYGGKHYLHGLKQHNIEAFTKHQSDAGKKGGKAVLKNINKEWHKKGGSASSTKRSAMYLYKITTPIGEIFNVNGLEFKAVCEQRGWNYNTLHWKKSQGKFIKRGEHKGFKVDLIQSP